MISDRKDHLDQLELEIKNQSIEFEQHLEIVRLDGDLSQKKRRSALEQIQTYLAQKKSILLLSTGSLIGEGFDLPELDCLILATPLSFVGRMVQYAGRIHRLAQGKTRVRVIDFVDSYSAMLLKMYKNRIKAYQKMGYLIQEPTGIFSGRGLPLRYSIENVNEEFNLE